MPWARRRIPLAWLLLVRQPVRLAIALAGIGFAGILMFMQLGFRDGLFDASVTIHRLFDADLVLVSPRTMSSISMATFPEGRLVQSLADPDVAAMTPVQWEFVLWRNPQTRQTRSILALGFDPEDPLLSDPAVQRQAPLLRLPGRLLFDERSRPEFGPVAEWFRAGRSVQTEVSGQRLRVAGLVQLGPSFGADGNMLVSRETFRTIAPPGSRGGIQLGLLRLRQGVDPLLVQKRLDSQLPSDVRVYTKDQFIEFEKDYWRSSTAIGFIFTLGAAMGFVVGCVIVYQILYGDVSDHLPEYATLMAMGYGLADLLGVVAREGLLLALLGYIPAYGVAQGLYALIRNSTRLPVLMEPQRAGIVFGLILSMCLFSALLAMRRLADADPADIF